MAIMQLPTFDTRRIVVAGDVMLDRYWHGDTWRISPEAPVPVVSVNADEERPGGAANVALNLASLGVRVQLHGLTGDDEAADRLQVLLDSRGIGHQLIRVDGRDTITKLRVLSHHQQLIRLDFEKGLQFNPGDAWCETLQAAVQRMDVLVLSDYAKGSLQQAKRIIAAARQSGVAVVVDPKGRDFSRYHGATLVTPNLAEFEMVAGGWRDEDDLVEKAQRLRDDFQWQALLITRGAQGMTLVEAQQVLHLPAHAKEVFDVTGAGDTVVAVVAAALAAGQSFTEAATLANIAASIVVGKLGAAVVTPVELQQATTAQLHPPPQGVVDEGRLGTAVADARTRGERLVMTNGCFDLLHAGHVDYLQKARALGDRLIVAVNDDASIRRLKGEQRPIHTVFDRMEVIAALACVDWVVPFSEDTPERLICDTRPDVLVKGDDYHVDDIAGQQCVRANGGQVITLPLRPGHGTSAIIEKIRRLQQEGI